MSEEGNQSGMSSWPWQLFMLSLLVASPCQGLAPSPPSPCATLADSLNAAASNFNVFETELEGRVERTVRTARAARAGDTLFRVPRARLLSSARDGVRSTPLGRVAATLPGTIEADFLACWLITVDAGACWEGSVERLFLDTLPRDFSHVPDFWRPADFKRLLRGTYMERVIEARQAAEGVRFEGLKAAAAAAAPSLPADVLAGLSPEAFKWAHGIVRSRGFHGPDDEDTPSMTMIPLVDMINHNDEPTCCYDYSESGDFVVTARNDMEAGAELLLRYGR